MLFLIVAIGLGSIPALVFSIEVLGALLAAGLFTSDDELNAGRVAVVVPAHNESKGIIPTLQDVLSQSRGHDRVIVVADNCDDDTAAVAAAHGAEVLVRNEPDLRGKGYAMAWAVAHLKEEPPDFVLFVDADCRLEAGLVARLLHRCIQVQRPVQALYLMVAGVEAAPRQRVAEFAWRLKNWVRPLGLSRFGWPVQLMGTGMIFPWNVIKSVSIASGSIVEDLKLGLDLAIAGAPAHFLSTAKVTSEFPTVETGAEVQRERWIQGHLAIIKHYAPRLLLEALVKRRGDLAVLTFDLLVPPMSLLVLISVGMIAAAGLTTLISGDILPVSLALLNFALLSLSLLLAWWKFGRDILAVGHIPLVAGEILRRVRLFKNLIGRPRAQWIRADRRKAGD